MTTATMRAIHQEILGGPLAEAAKASELGEQRHVAGKLVLTVP
jgi:hypothetical protein